MAEHDRRQEIPTHLEVEDTLLFGLTLRQAVITLVGVALGFLVYSQARRLPWEWPMLGGAPHAHLPLWIQIVCGTLPALLALAVALILPAGRPIEDWLFALARYAAQPKRCVWRPRTATPPTSTRDGDTAFVTLRKEGAEEYAALGKSTLPHS
jgi:hypothetical protein